MSLDINRAEPSAHSAVAAAVSYKQHELSVMRAYLAVMKHSVHGWQVYNYRVSLGFSFSAKLLRVKRVNSKSAAG